MQNEKCKLQIGDGFSRFSTFFILPFAFCKCRLLNSRYERGWKEADAGYFKYLAKKSRTRKMASSVAPKS